MSDDNIQTWWEIPSIVHFCKVFSPFCEDLCPININDFEHAIEENSLLLTDMVVRFMKIYGYYDLNTNEWWTSMKQLFQYKCSEYNFENPLESVGCFDDLTPKQKVKVLYIMCHIFLDVETIQDKISKKPELWHNFNIKPLGYDLNNSVYWYFGTTRLYREDYENSSVLHNTIQLSELNGSNSSKNVHPLSSLTQLYWSGILGSGKWNTICDDDNDSWYSFVDDIKFSKNNVIRSLHNAVGNIIKNLPIIKRNKPHYKYLMYTKLGLRKKNVFTRSHLANEPQLFIGNISTNKHSLLNFQEMQIKHDENKQLDKPKIDFVQNRNVLQSKNVYKDENHSVKRYCNGTIKSQLKNNNTTEVHNPNIDENDFDLSKPRQDCHFYEAQVNLNRYDQENIENLQNF